MTLSFPIDPEISAAIDAQPYRVNRFGYDAWGYHPETAKRFYSAVRRLLWPYFRPEVHGIENLPSGRVLIVPNHGGQLPNDSLMISLACLLHARPPRLVRSLFERVFPRLPFLGVLHVRYGGTLGDPTNAKGLLEEDQAVMVFPEGGRGLGKTWRHRYELASFGRGFMRLVLKTRTPIVPVAVIGAEEAMVSLANIKPLARSLDTAFVPLPLLLPVLGPLAYFVPLPTKFRIYFGQPMRFEGAHDDEDAVVDAKVAVVEAQVQGLVAEGLAKRRGIFT